MLKRGGYKIGEQPLGEGVANHALRVPLNAYDPVGAAGPLDSLDGAVGSRCSNAQVRAGAVDGLVMAAVDRALFVLAYIRQVAPGSERGLMCDVAFSSAGRQIGASMDIRGRPLRA